jgi:primary-amine oxidase
VEEYGKWPLPPNAGNYTYGRACSRQDYRADIKPLTISQPQGPSFNLNGHHCQWQKWDFVIGFNARESLTIHHLRYEDKGKKRPIFYR